MKPAKLLSATAPILITACTFGMGQGVASITPVLDDGGSAGGFSRPRLGEDDPGYVRPDGRSETDLAPLRTELSLLASAQRTYRGSRGQYAPSVEILREVVNYVPSQGIRVSVVRATAEGFSAIASRGLTECAIFVGEVDPPRDYVRSAGAAGCEGA